MARFNIRKLGAKAQAQIKGAGQGRIKRSAKEDRTADGIVFDSASEMRGYLFLKPRIKPGCLHLQPKFELQPKFRDVNGKVRQPMNYRGDFWIYSEPRTDATAPIPAGAVVIDNKGMITDSFTIREKLFAFRFMTRLHLPRNKRDWAALLEHTDMQPWLA